MGTQNRDTAAAILEASRKEFMEYGYEKASLRRIAKEASVTTGAIYGYFAGKDALFAALTEDAAEELVELYTKVHSDFASLPPEEQPDMLNVVTEECVPWLVNYVYDHFEAFKLLLCCGAPGCGERFFDRLAEVEEMRRCGLMEGDSAGRMNPARPVTRAEGVTLFMRLTKQLQAAGAEVGLDGPATPAALEDITFTVERTEMAVGERQQLTYGFPMGAVVPGPLSFDAYCTSDSSREVVTVSGTGLITAVAPGQAAVVLKMEQGGDSGVHIKTVLLTVSGEENPERPEPEGPTEEAVYAAITALKADYPEGMRWTNDNFYASQALRSGGYGCEGFALICSDAAFGTLPARTHRSFEAIRVGDMIRIGDYHTVVVLEKKENSVMVTEGNYNSSIHWGREITRSSLEREGFSVRTRYPA